MAQPQTIEDFKAVRLKLASPESIFSWSHGEVTKPETINYRTQRPEKDGLFDEKIFGPIKDWECYCGKYKRIRYKGIVCDRCGVEVTKASVRRERMGHIKLASPVAHIWFVRGVPSRLGLLLDLSVSELEQVIYFASYIITSVDENIRQEIIEQIESEFKQKKNEIEQRYAALRGQAQSKKPSKIEDELKRLAESESAEVANLTRIRDLARQELKGLRKYRILSELEYRDLSLKYGPVFHAGIGAGALQQLVKEINLEEIAQRLAEDTGQSEGANRRKAIRRLRLVRSMIQAGIRPEWMFISILPVIPPDLRPMVQLDGGRFAASDLNDLYRRVINRNNRLKKLLDIGAPEVITRNERRMLQEAVDALIDNSIRHGREVMASTGQRRKLRSIADMLKGKQGRFRQNLLGKRVDYSGRSVIVVGPHLRLHQCGLPKKMALELFKPFVISKLIAREYAHNVRSANRLIEQGRAEVYDILEEVTREKYVLLNRAPTLHRLGFQAFQPILIEGKAIQIHPMVCIAFNADFDGDQMAVHVPLTAAAQKEAEEIMLSAKNLLKPASGQPVVHPDKDVVLGIYYMTKIKPGATGEGKIFSSENEAVIAYYSGIISLRARITVRIRAKGKTERIETCVGRILLNRVLPEEIRFRNDAFDKKKLRDLVRECYRDYGIDRTVNLVDDLKQLGFLFLTRSGLSWGMDDLVVPEAKRALLTRAEAEVEETYRLYREGLLTEEERYRRVIEIWAQVRDEITRAVAKSLDEHGPVGMMVESGARGSSSQVTQMTGMKGLVVNPTGKVIELPAKDSYKEGLSVLEYFIATHGARKGMTDTALRTADAGYLTRRLVDVAQDIVIQAPDCGTTEGRLISRKESETLGKSFSERLFGRVVAEDVREAKGTILVKKGEHIDDVIAEKLEKSKVEEVKVRSVLGCILSRGICAACYGYDLAYNGVVKEGVAVGIVAAQAIGEPGTQLTMRTFHTGGIAEQDITQGLPRVEELFEAREPHGQAVIAEVSGTVRIARESSQEILIRIEKDDAEHDTYLIPDNEKNAKALMLTEGKEVRKGETLFQGPGGVVRALHDGRVHKIEKRGDTRTLIVERRGDTNTDYSIPAGMNLVVRDGQRVEAGDQLTEGSLNLGLLLRYKGAEATQRYIIREVVTIYASQGQNINEKHIEIIIRQMFSRLRITDPGNSTYLPGDLIDRVRLREENARLTAQNLKPIAAEQLLMGITKASLNTDSFLAAASFQETTRVLIEAAITGKMDTLRGLKENVIIGKLIPAGTGYRKT